MRQINVKIRQTGGRWGWGADLPSPNYEGSAVIVTCYSWLSVLIGYYNQQYIIITIIHVIPEEHLFFRQIYHHFNVRLR